VDVKPSDLVLKRYQGLCSQCEQDPNWMNKRSATERGGECPRCGEPVDNEIGEDSAYCLNCGWQGDVGKAYSHEAAIPGAGTQLPSDTLCVRCLGKGKDRTCLNPKEHGPTWLHDCAEHGRVPDPFGRRTHETDVFHTSVNFRTMNMRDEAIERQFYLGLKEADSQGPAGQRFVVNYTDKGQPVVHRPGCEKLGEPKGEYWASDEEASRTQPCENCQPKTSKTAQDESGGGVSSPPSSDTASPLDSSTTSSSCGHCGGVGACYRPSCQMGCGSGGQCLNCGGWGVDVDSGRKWLRKKRKKKPSIASLSISAEDISKNVVTSAKIMESAL
jgi:hypothetical protein